MRHGPLQLLLDVPDTDELLAWAAAPFKPLAGQVVFYSDAQSRLPRESISFAAGQCVSYAENFDNGTGGGGTGAYVCALPTTVLPFALTWAAGMKGRLNYFKRQSARGIAPRALWRLKTSSC